MRNAPHNGERYELFGPSQGQHLVAITGAPLLGQLPIDPHIAHICDTGEIESYESAPYKEMTENFLKIVERAPDAAPAQGGLLKIGRIVR